jgi:hypothetical protein
LTILGFLSAAATAISPTLLSRESDPQCTTSCTQFVPAAPGCSDCLLKENTTLLGFINPPYLAFIVAVCKCQIPTCRDLTLAEKQCQVTNPNDTTCACPATLKDAPECYKCLEANEPSLAGPLGQRVALCNGTSSSTTTNSSSSPSQSSLPTFTSGSKSFVSQLDLRLAIAIVIAVVVHAWM